LDGQEEVTNMAEDRKLPGSLSVLDSALIVAMFSAVCFVMGHAAQLGAARRMGVPMFLMPHVGPETVILIGATYLILLCAVGLLLYFVWILAGQRVGLLKSSLGPVFSGMRSRAKQHPRTYLLLACLAGAATIYSVPLLLPFTPRSAGGQRAFGGPVESIVVTLRLKESDADLAGRNLKYLWKDAGIVLLQDTGSGELVLIKEDEIR